MQPKTPQQQEPTKPDNPPLAEPLKSVRPKLTALQVSDEEIREWADLPATRLYFKSLADQVKMYKEVAARAYRRGAAEASYGILAEATGAIELLGRLIEASHGDGLIFNQEDREEVGYGNRD